MCVWGGALHYSCRPVPGAGAPAAAGQCARHSAAEQCACTCTCTRLAEIEIEVPVEHGLLVENLLDLAHAPFTHTSTFAKGWPVPGARVAALGGGCRG